MPDSNLDRAYAIFKRAVDELALPEALEPEQLAAKLRSASNRILDALEGKNSDPGADVFDRLHEQSNDIAEDLKRVERLMRKHMQGDE